MYIDMLFLCCINLCYECIYNRSMYSQHIHIDTELLCILEKNSIFTKIYIVFFCQFPSLKYLKFKLKIYTLVHKVLECINLNNCPSTMKN